MRGDNRRDIIDNDIPKKKILLLLLPFWTPQIPPLGISCLKSFLQPYGFQVKTVDLNVEEELRALYNKYFNTLRGYVLESKRGNFYNIGHEVMQNHMMAHLNYENEEEYHKLVKILIYKTFFIKITNEQVEPLYEIIQRFYNRLEGFIIDHLSMEQPDVLGISVYKGTVPASMFVFKLAKENYPRLRTVMGGAVFAQSLGIGTPDFDLFLEKTKCYIDHIIIGEGENLFLGLLKGRLPETQRVFTLEDINGEILDLSPELVGIPDFSDLNIQYYPILSAYSSRSCPFQCTFCTETVFWGKYRKKNAKQVVNELIQLYKTYQSQLFMMCDSLLNPIITNMAREFAGMEESIYWDGYLRVDTSVCDPDMVQLWRNGGFYRARLGIESGSPRILKMMNKNIDIQQIKSAIFNLANAGIKTTTYWIIGYPGETEEDFQKTLDLVSELKDDIYEAECNPFGYYFTGQEKSSEWAQSHRAILLYPESAHHMLIIQTWVLDGIPSREETYKRIGRFVEHCRQLGIANPYSMYDIYKADERWKKLHKNAVPSLVEYKNKQTYINENKSREKISFLQTAHQLQDGSDFKF